MSRAIKFRVWDIDNKEFVYISETVDGEIWVNNGVSSVTMPEHKEPYEQYTGLKDKNGKEIYEGDIVKNIEGVNETAVCAWDESNAEFDFVCVNGKCTRDNVKSWLEMYEVIGNIHENKELLGGGE